MPCFVCSLCTSLLWWQDLQSPPLLSNFLLLTFSNPQPTHSRCFWRCRRGSERLGCLSHTTPFFYLSLTHAHHWPAIKAILQTDVDRSAAPTPPTNDRKLLASPVEKHERTRRPQTAAPEPHDEQTSTLVDGRMSCHSHFSIKACKHDATPSDLFSGNSNANCNRPTIRNSERPNMFDTRHSFSEQPDRTDKSPSTLFLCGRWGEAPLFVHFLSFFLNFSKIFTNFYDFLLQFNYFWNYLCRSNYYFNCKFSYFAIFYNFNFLP